MLKRRRGGPMEPIIRRMFERVLHGARALLGDGTFSQLWEEPHSMTIEQVLAYVWEE